MKTAAPIFDVDGTMIERAGAHRAAHERDDDQLTHMNSLETPDA
jgi:phosphoglycolate phosphatase-like HAD superfamily hydrolase